MILNRFLYASDCTVGTLQIGDKTFFTLEPAWRNNKEDISCIPCGTYMIRPHGWEEDTQSRFKDVWEIRDVPNRKNILIHIGNYPHDTSGCVLVGTGLVVNTEKDSYMVTNSKNAIDYMRECIRNGFITIED